MKFFIDTANLDQIKEAQDLGVLDGVTTNPSLMAKEGITGKENIINQKKNELFDLYSNSHLSKLKKDMIIKKISKLKKNPDRIIV